MKELKLNKPFNEIFRFLNGFWIGIIGLLELFWLIMVLLASFLFKRLIFIPKLLKMTEQLFWCVGLSIRKDLFKV